MHFVLKSFKKHPGGACIKVTTRGAFSLFRLELFPLVPNGASPNRLFGFMGTTLLLQLVLFAFAAFNIANGV